MPSIYRSQRIARRRDAQPSIPAHRRSGYDRGMTRWHAGFALLSFVTSRVMWGVAAFALLGVVFDLGAGADPTKNICWLGGSLLVGLLTHREAKRISRDLPPYPGERPD